MAENKKATGIGCFSILSVDCYINKPSREISSR